ncbi:MAG: FG-GAP repeat protein [Candidatus Zixiibacteriota bacterium]|nr:MAG: FG-GAP repeat protein [candidate division Zixibacteria bacterium]
MKLPLALLIILTLSSSGFGYEFVGAVQGEKVGDQYGSAFCTVDFNNDGFQDLVVAAPAADDAGTSSGKVYIYYGGPLADSAADLTIVGVAGSFFGKALSSGGDYNNDGSEDLLVGAPFYDLPASNAGAVFVFFGGISPDTTVDMIITGEAESDYFGTAVAGMVDFNNDSRDDIAVGAYRANWGSFENAGKVYLYYGDASPDQSFDRILVGEADGERFGYSVAAGDFDGDNNPDLAVGAYSYDDTEINQGRVYIFNGGPSTDTLPDLIITGQSAGHKFGWSLASGHVLGGSWCDLVMGTDGFEIGATSAGRVYLFDGGPGMDGIAAFTHDLGRPEEDLFGFAVGSGADLDADGYDDIIAGMPGNDDGGDSAGGARIFLGGASVTVDTTVLGASMGEQLGHAVVIWNDFGPGDGTALAVGGIGYDNFRGRVFLFSNPDTVSHNQAPALSPISDTAFAFGSLLQFSVYAVDPDSDDVSLYAPLNPDGASFLDNGNGSGFFEWQTGPDDMGSHEVLFVASDGLLADSESVVITVLDTAGCCVGLTGNVDGDESDLVDIGDLTKLIDYLFISYIPPVCIEEANCDAAGVVDISDLTVLIDYLFISYTPPAACD